MTRTVLRYCLAATGVALVVIAIAGNTPRLLVRPAPSLTFEPFDPQQPRGAGYSVLSGDPEKGPSHMLMRYGRAGGAMHSHSFDYQAVVIKGVAKHWADGDDEAAAPPLPPGSYWSQPARQRHADACLEDECVIFVTWSGKMD